MTRFFPSAMTLIALAAPVQAADMPVKARPVAVSIYDWNGFYTGGHCGGAWGRTRHTGDDEAFDEGGSEIYALKPEGLVCGVQAGYNVHQGNWFFGIESQFGAIGARDTIDDRTTPVDNLNQVRYRWYGTVTGRLGIVRDNVLLYGKGGLAYARIHNIAADTDSSEIDLTESVVGTRTRVGWTGGAGVEYGLAPQWSIKAEYLYMDFGTYSATSLDGGVYTIRNNIHTVTFGINYRWGGSSVVARY